MFIRYLHDLVVEPNVNRDRRWRFHLRDGVRLEGRVVNHISDAQGHPIMIQINTNPWYEPVSLLADIPWTSVIYIEELY